MQQVEILLVEDNENDAELALRALHLNNKGNKVHHVKDGPEALEYLFAQGKYALRKIENIPNLILLDVKLPKLNGLEVLKQIKEDERTKKIPVVMLTSSKETLDIDESYKLGANSYIVKPVESENFKAALQQIETYWILINQTPNSL